MASCIFQFYIPRPIHTLELLLFHSVCWTSCSGLPNSGMYTKSSSLFLVPHQPLFLPPLMASLVTQALGTQTLETVIFAHVLSLSLSASDPIGNQVQICHLTEAVTRSSWTSWRWRSFISSHSPLTVMGDFSTINKTSFHGSTFLSLSLLTALSSQPQHFPLTTL